MTDPVAVAAREERDAEFTAQVARTAAQIAADLDARGLKACINDTSCRELIPAAARTCQYCRRSQPLGTGWAAAAASRRPPVNISVGGARP